MKLYNTLTRKKEEFVPIEQGKVKMYSCGPTVYNYFHIGNARPFIIFDALRNYFEYKGYEVTFVQNFTDVDDKIINRAKEEGITPFEVADKYIAEYFKDADALGVKRANVHPRVTETMEDIIAFIAALVSNGHAYESNGDVYFDTQKFKEYGKLSKQNLAELNMGARIDVNEQKRHPMDFAVWKAAKDGEISWDTPWGKGRPGWHIECSVMSRKYLGDTIDIHSGGQDLIFPHHENEIAQSEARTGKQFSNFWLHNGYLNINNEKMSKSLNNFFTVRDISAQMDLEIVRFFLLSAHYRNPVNFSEELLESAKAGMQRIYNTKEKLEFLLEHAVSGLKAEEKIEELDQFKVDFERALDDDFNTADGITAIFELAKFINTSINDETSKEYLEACLAMFKKLTKVLNIIQKVDKAENEEEIESLIAQRSEAKKNKDFAGADAIRNKLLEMGIELLDSRQGTTWKKVK